MTENVLLAGDPVTVDLAFLTYAGPFDDAFDQRFDTVSRLNPLYSRGDMSSQFSTEFVQTENPYGTVRGNGPDHPLWRKFSYPRTPKGLLLFRDDQRIKLVSSFYDSEFAAADDAILGGQYYVCAFGCWQAVLLKDYGFYLVPADNLNAIPYVLDEQGEML